MAKRLYLQALLTALPISGKGQRIKPAALKMSGWLFSKSVRFRSFDFVNVLKD